MNKIISLLFILMVSPVFAEQAFDYGSISENYDEAMVETTADHRGSYYDWGRAQNGYGYCYQWASNGRVLNEGRPVSNYNCERDSPSFYNWARANNGWGYCYQYTAYGVSMNEGKPQSNYNCERVSPSFYTWGRANNGHTYCYQKTRNGHTLNEGKPVSNYYCR